VKVETRDVLGMQAIRPVDAALYLRAGGWEQVATQPGRSSVWCRVVDGEEYEALLAMDQGLRDYSLRIGELLRVLAAAERRSESQVYSDLLTITSDVTRIRIMDPELTDGTLPIEDNAQIAQKARDLMLAAACAATERRAVWHTRKPEKAIEHVRKVRIGQSERGSYVITIISRVTPLLHTLQEQLFETDPPYERQVTQTLAESLVALDRAAEHAALTQQMSAFEEEIPKGVNANLCDAVVGLWGGNELRRDLEFAFSWAPARPAPVELPRRISISADRMPVIREAGRLMRERAPVTDFELRGAVVKLVRPEGAATGKVTVVGLLDDRPVHVTMELDDGPYHLAVTAHDQGKTLRVVGTLAKDGRIYQLQKARDLVIDEE
jgi:hypothetical protein